MPALAMPEEPPNRTSGGKPHWFPVTSWTKLMVARDGTNTAARGALESLCQAYWRPVFSYIRSRGHRAHDAEDLTQSFFYLIIEKNFLRAADRKKGRFRSFLLASVNHFLANHHDFNNALKRGGGKIILSLDRTEEDDQPLQVPSENLTPEQIFERRWATAVHDQVIDRLRQELPDPDKVRLLEEVKGFLAGEAKLGDYRAIADRLNIRANTIAVSVHRLRDRYWKLLREEIERTVGSAEEVDAELRHLCRLLGCDPV